MCRDEAERAKSKLSLLADDLAEAKSRVLDKTELATGYKADYDRLKLE